MAASKNSALLLACTLALSACAVTTQDVVSIGNGHYEIAGSSVTALSSGGAEKLKLLKVASQYCGARGKQVLLLDATATNGHVGAGAFANGEGNGATFTAAAFHPGERATADVIFECQK